MIRKVEINMILHVEDTREIDLSDTSNWSVAILDVKNKQLIFDTDLNLKGERSFRPKLRIK